MPKDCHVALATLVEKPFSDPKWLFEIKWDGERTLAYLQGGELELQARSGRTITHEFPDLHNIPKQVMALNAILDGEIVVLDENGRSDFQRIQRRFGAINPAVSLQKSVPGHILRFRCALIATATTCARSRCSNANASSSKSFSPLNSSAIRATDRKGQGAFRGRTASAARRNHRQAGA